MQTIAIAYHPDTCPRARRHPLARLAIASLVAAMTLCSATALGASAAPGAASNSAPIGGPAPAVVPAVIPNESLEAYKLGAPASRYVANDAGLKLAPHTFEIIQAAGSTYANVTIHIGQAGRVDGVTASSRRLAVEGQALGLGPARNVLLRQGYDRVSPLLARHGWSVGACSAGGGHFAAIGLPSGPHTYIVWRHGSVTVAIGAAGSPLFALAKTHCAALA